MEAACNRGGFSFLECALIRHYISCITSDMPVSIITDWQTHNTLQSITIP